MIINKRIFILACFSFFASSLAAQPSRISFDHLNSKNGLSDGRIDCILQDRHGFLWVGTQDGLNRYDGYNFTVFDHDPFDSTSISSNWIRYILEDRFQHLWIGTEGGGLNRFNPETETFSRWVHEPGNPQSLPDNFVRCLLEDSDGVLWIAMRSGLVQFDRSENRFLPFHEDPSNPDSPAFNENVNKIFEDSEHNLWIGTTDNVYRYRKKDRTLEHFAFNGTTERISALLEDHEGNVWIGSRYNGLRKFDKKSQTFISFRNWTDDPKGISSNEIKDIFEDRDQNLWVATMHGGLNLLDRKTGRFEHFIHDPRDPSSLSGSSVRTIYQDRTGVVWIGMDGSGLDRFVKGRYKFQVYGKSPGLNPDLIQNTILSILEDSEGLLWIGTEGGGLNRFSRETGSAVSFQFDKTLQTTLSSNQVTALFEDRDGVLWVGTKEGLNRFDRAREAFHRYYVKTTRITSNNYINVILEDRSGRLLLGTNGGVLTFDKKTGEFVHLEYDENDLLNNESVVTLWLEGDLLWIGYLRSGLVAYHQKTGKFVHYRSDANKPNSLSNNFVQYIFQDKMDQLWIATRKGLNRFDLASGGFREYTKADGLPSNVIVAILEDESGNLWLGTTNGLSRFNPEKKTFTNYDVDDGLQGNQFWIGSCFRSPSGELFFGGNNGFNAFYPDKIDEMANPNIPPIVITGVKILNKPAQQGVSVYPLGQGTLRLSSHENHISFEFAALDFTQPEKNQFAYKLEGLDKDWIYAGTRRYANYTNLAPGDYTFRVKGTNNDGVWNEEGASLDLIIPTPFWKTGWAYLLYVIVLGGLIYGINAYIIGLVRMKHDLKIERMEKEKVQEINQFKLQFFTDVAHEFKTPLTLIQAPLEEILASIKKGVPFEGEFRLMYRNVKYLLRLIHQLLFFRQAEQGRMALEVTPGDLVQFANEIFELFEESARKHHIVYRFETDSAVINGWFDWEKLEEILVNLIDNAFKYTPENGRITVRLSAPSADRNGADQVVIHVIDSGLGVGKDQLEHLFERFYHAKDRSRQKQASSGLGLALTRKLVELHHGQISVESEEGKGSHFIVTLPLGREHFSDGEVVKESSEAIHSHSVGTLPDEAIATDPNRERYANAASESDQVLILLVEDNDELRNYMKKTLGQKYRIAEAGDGQEGIEKARRLMPSLIISDVMMPLADGIELCHQIKGELATSHIPIILLTAKNEIEQKIKGIETGADDYIEKPFHFRFLDARIKNILKSREMLRQRYRKEMLLEPAEVSVASTDEKWLVRIREFIETHLSDPDLGVKNLSSEIGLSRTLLFIKLKELTGYTPQELIKTIRLKKAAQFLTKSDFTVSEIAYRVGFKYPKYFSTCFLQEFGMTPSEYREREKAEVVGQV